MVRYIVDAILIYTKGCSAWALINVTTYTAQTFKVDDFFYFKFFSLHEYIYPTSNDTQRWGVTDSLYNIAVWWSHNAFNEVNHIQNDPHCPRENQVNPKKDGFVVDTSECKRAHVDYA